MNDPPPVPPPGPWWQQIATSFAGAIIAAIPLLALAGVNCINARAQHEAIQQHGEQLDAIQQQQKANTKTLNTVKTATE